MDFEIFTMVPMWVLVHLRCCLSKSSTRRFSQVWLERRWTVTKFEQVYCYLPTGTYCRNLARFGTFIQTKFILCIGRFFILKIYKTSSGKRQLSYTFIPFKVLHMQSALINVLKKPSLHAKGPPNRGPAQSLLQVRVPQVSRSGTLQLQEKHMRAFSSIKQGPSFLCLSNSFIHNLFVLR
jgi:hypothetical protein